MYIENYNVTVNTDNIKQNSYNFYLACCEKYKKKISFLSNNKNDKIKDFQELLNIIKEEIDSNGECEFIKKLQSEVYECIGAIVASGRYSLDSFRQLPINLCDAACIMEAAIAYSSGRWYRVAILEEVFSGKNFQNVDVFRSVFGKCVDGLRDISIILGNRKNKQTSQVEYTNLKAKYDDLQKKYNELSTQYKKVNTENKLLGEKCKKYEDEQNGKIVAASQKRHERLGIQLSAWRENQKDRTDKLIPIQKALQEELKNLRDFETKLQEDYIYQFGNIMIDLFNTIDDCYTSLNNRTDNIEDRYKDAIGNYINFMDIITDNMYDFGIDEFVSNCEDNFDGKIHDAKNLNEVLSVKTAVIKESLRQGFRYNDYILAKEQVMLKNNADNHDFDRPASVTKTPISIGHNQIIGRIV